MAALAFPDNHCIISTNILSQASRWATPHSHHPPSPPCRWAITLHKAKPPAPLKMLKSHLATAPPGSSKSQPQKVPAPRRLGQTRGPELCAGAGRPRPRRSHCPRSPHPAAFRPPLSVAHTRAGRAARPGLELQQQLRRPRGRGRGRRRGGPGGRRGRARGEAAGAPASKRRARRAPREARAAAWRGSDARSPAATAAPPRP